MGGIQQRKRWQSLSFLFVKLDNKEREKITCIDWVGKKIEMKGMIKVFLECFFFTHLFLHCFESLVLPEVVYLLGLSL